MTLRLRQPGSGARKDCQASIYILVWLSAYNDAGVPSLEAVTYLLAELD